MQAKQNNQRVFKIRSIDEKIHHYFSIVYAENEAEAVQKFKEAGMHGEAFPIVADKVMDRAVVDLVAEVVEITDPEKREEYLKILWREGCLKRDPKTPLTFESPENFTVFCRIKWHYADLFVALEKRGFKKITRQMLEALAELITTQLSDQSVARGWDVIADGMTEYEVTPENWKRQFEIRDE